LNLQVNINYISMLMNRLIIVLTVFIFFGFMFACGNSEQQDESGLTEFQLNHGIGPVTERLDLGEIDMDLANEGREIFESVCVACHQLDATISGPMLRNVVERREPEFIMNYIQNPAEMRERHPEGQQLDEDYTIQMVNMGTSLEDARALLEYLRAAAEGEF
jgi:cytochrome c